MNDNTSSLNLEGYLTTSLTWIPLASSTTTYEIEYIDAYTKRARMVLRKDGMTVAR